MLQSFMIISGRGAIVLYRKIFVKSIGQPRMIAGLITALCEYATGAIGLPVSYMEMERVAISVVEQPASSGLPESLRCIAFHDVDDGEQLGTLVSTALLQAFIEEYRERFTSLRLANTEGVEDLFKGFSSKVRFAIQDTVIPLMRQLEQEDGINRAILFRHHRGRPSRLPLDIWFCSGNQIVQNITPDVQALLQVADDLLISRGDTAGLIMLGDYVHIERMSLATLLVTSTAPTTMASLAPVIDSTTVVLHKRTLFYA